MDKRLAPSHRPRERNQVSEPKFVLSNGKSYFEKWVPIGPVFTSNLEEAMRFDSRQNAMLESSRHFGFIDYAPYEVES
jgi:hypothetical protein